MFWSCFNVQIKNGLFYAVSVGTPSERMSNFVTVRCFKTDSEPNFGFLHIPT